MDNINQITNNKREYLLSGAGKKGFVYATNQELPHQKFKEEAVYSITQDCNSIKSKIIKHVLDQKPLPYLLDQKPLPGETATTPNPFHLLLSSDHRSRHGVVLSRRRRTQPQGLF